MPLRLISTALLLLFLLSSGVYLTNSWELMDRREGLSLLANFGTVLMFWTWVRFESTGSRWVQRIRIELPRGWRAWLFFLLVALVFYGRLVGAWEAYQRQQAAADLPPASTPR